MKLLIIGGTRLLGKRIVQNFIESGVYDIAVISRKADIYKNNCRIIAKERSEGLEDIANESFDIVLDFIAYDDKSVAEVINKVSFGKYILISTCWMTKLNKRYKIDEFIEEIDSDALTLLPEITQKYLLDKRSAENYLNNKLKRGNFHIFRLPIFWGEDDHTKRVEFYVSRFLDDEPLIMVNNGKNICQISNVNDLSTQIFKILQSSILVDQPILEALPNECKSTSDILNIISKAVGSRSELIGINEEVLKKHLPEYLNEEPLWRENIIQLSKNNVYALLNSQTESIETWLSKLSLYEMHKKPITSILRKKELQFLIEKSE